MVQFRRVFVFLFILLSFSILSQENSSFAEANDIVKDERLHGFALKQPVNVYANPSRDARILKQYNYNHPLIYRTYSNTWHEATVYINGKPNTGYIHVNDVGDSSNSSSVMGIALNKTHVYSSTDNKSRVLKSYNKGSILKYRSYKKGWLRATVYLNGKPHTGYIQSKDVQTSFSTQQSLKGIGTKKPTRVYSRASTDSRVLKSYNAGHVLKYRTFSNNWYEATVFVNGKRHIGYISTRDVEEITSNQETLKGVGIKKPTRVYSRASTDSRVLKSYNAGHVLKYRTFSNNWYEATVFVNGTRHTGYISTRDVEEITSNQETLRGVGIKKPTRVYSRASSDSRVLKSYKYGHILKYRTFTSGWYEATVYINGKAQTGYINKRDVNNNINSVLNGYALSNPTVVYSEPSKNSRQLKSYRTGHALKYRAYNSPWFSATVYINGKAQKGYIHSDDVSPTVPTFKSYALASPTHVYSSTSRKSSKLKSYKRGHLLKYRYHNNNWYKATVFINGKARTGYINVNDVGSKSQLNSPIYVNGILIVNKQYHLPSNYAPGESAEARRAFNRMAKDAKKAGFNLTAFSTYRTFAYQRNLFNNYAKQHGINAANRFSARPGESEHQTGLAFDVGEVGKQQHWANDSFGNTKASSWIARNAHKYGFIVRYPKGKEHITGYKYEPWHLRYVGVNHATNIYRQGVTLEEYLGLY